MPRPRGGDWLPNDLRRLRQAGVTVLASLLEVHELAELELLALAGCCSDAGIRLRSYPIPDRGLPSSLVEAQRFIHALNADVDSGAGLAVHCRAGIGRSSLIAGAVLVSHGITVADAFLRIQEARGLPVPDTEEQVRWLERFAAVPPAGARP